MGIGMYDADRTRSQVIERERGRVDTSKMTMQESSVGGDSLYMRESESRNLSVVLNDMEFRSMLDEMNSIRQENAQLRAV